MSQLLPYEFLINDEGTEVAGHALNKLKSEFGDTTAAIVDRVARANAATFPNHKYDPVTIFVKTVAAAIVAGPYEPPEE